MPFPAFWASKFALKFMLTILVFEIKEENKRTKSKKILTIIFHYLLEGDSNSWRPRVWGRTPAENFWNLKPGNAIFCILSMQICSKIYANYTCIWNKRRKNAQTPPPPPHTQVSCTFEACLMPLAISKRFGEVKNLVVHKYLTGYVRVKSNRDQPPPGNPRAFDLTLAPYRREFDGPVGNFTAQPGIWPFDNNLLSSFPQKYVYILALSFTSFLFCVFSIVQKLLLNHKYQS
jgi:hypothetical protein